MRVYGWWWNFFHTILAADRKKSQTTLESVDSPVIAIPMNHKETMMSWIKSAAKKISGEASTVLDEMTDFVQDPVESFNSMAEELREWRQKVANVNPAGVSEEIWGEAGRFAYPAGAAIMAKRSPTGEPLSIDHKAALRPYFGELVDRVAIHWGTPPLDEWAADRYSISLEDTDTIAQTYGHDIYVRYGKGDKGVEATLADLAHELYHAGQYEKHGTSYSNFGYHYFKGFKKAGMSYASNPMEMEAFAFAEEFTRTYRTRGDLHWYRHEGWQDGRAKWTDGNGVEVGNGGWNSYKSVFTTSSGIIYGITTGGDLHWYRHEGWQNGSGRWTDGNGIRVGNGGWESYKSVFASSDGIIYGITTGGDLHWYRHDGWQDGRAKWTGDGIRVGNGGWESYKSVFATSNGIIYGITNGGDLHWYRHDGWQDGRAKWTGDGIKVGNGWHSYRSVFASSHGIIYGITTGGDLHWYRHDGWQNGSAKWTGDGIKVGSGWHSYKSVIATGEGILYGVMP